MKTYIRSILFILFATVLSPFASNAQSAKRFQYTNEEETFWHALKGNVKEVRVYSLKESFGDLEKAYLTNIVKYDEKRTLIEDFSFDADSNLIRKTIYRYSGNGDILEKSVYNMEGKLSERTIYKYDDARNSIDVSMYKSDGKLSEKYIIKHDGKGHKTMQSEYNANGEIVWKHLFDYDKNSNHVVLTYDSQNKITGKTVSRRNKYGQLVEEIQYKPNEKREWKSDYRYDWNGNCVEKSYWEYLKEKEELTIHLKEVSKYDLNNNCVETLFYSDEELDNRKIYEYDVKGNKTKEITTRGEAEIFWEGQLLEYEYY